MTDDVSKGSKASQYLVIPALLAVVALFAFSWTDSSTDLTPGHDSLILATGLAAALITTLAVLIATLWLRPRLRAPLYLAAPLLALASGLLAGLIAFNVADRFIQAIGFRSNVTRLNREYPISRAYVSHGKGVSYHVQLADPFADFFLTESDYTQTFGRSEELRPVGYCLEVTVEQRGEAIRILYPSARAIPSGSVHKCSAT